MVRSMYSGVAGMKAHQTRMDVIGNNIANVNTYGFKSSRTTFRDVYYQNIRGAAAASNNTGGINPSSVGYGSMIASVDKLMTQSTMTNTGNPLDVAITGEGFLQVQDADGNIFYTKAGMLDIDANGNLVDLNGNFVLGVSGNPTGQAPGSNRIQISIDPVEAKPASVTESINGIKFTISATNNTEDGNVSISFGSSNELPLGQKAKAYVSTSGISVVLNAKEVFSSVADLQTAVNDAITEANGGTHPAGEFVITADPATKFNNLTGEQIAGKNFGYNKGTLKVANDATSKLFGGFTVATVGDGFTGTGDAKYSIKHTAATDDAEEFFTFSVEINGKTYTRDITKSQMETGGSAVLTATGAASNDTITINYPSYSTILGTSGLFKTTTYTEDDETNGNIPDGYKVGDKGPQYTNGQLTFETGADSVTVTDAATPSTPSSDLGLSSKIFKLAGGTEGGPQTVADLSGISIGADGVIVASHPVHGTIEVGRIDLATFDNVNGLEQSGNTYFTKTKASGEPVLNQPGTGGTGALKNSSLEMSNVDLSQEFSDMITTQRGFQANSRLITVSDTMLEELINLKR